MRNYGLLKLLQWKTQVLFYYMRKGTPANYKMHVVKTVIVSPTSKPLQYNKSISCASLNKMSITLLHSWLHSSLLFRICITSWLLLNNASLTRWLLFWTLKIIVFKGQLCVAILPCPDSYKLYWVIWRQFPPPSSKCNCCFLKSKLLTPGHRVESVVINLIAND